MKNEPKEKTKRIDYKNGQYYIGEVKNGKKHGKGTHFYKIPEGKGKLILDNGNYYIGSFKKGERHGKGKSYDSKGTLFS